MKAFSSIRREIKAIYKPRARDSRNAKDHDSPFELADASRPSSAVSQSSVDSRATNACLEIKPNDGPKESDNSAAIHSSPTLADDDDGDARLQVANDAPPGTTDDGIVRNEDETAADMLPDGPVNQSSELQSGLEEEGGHEEARELTFEEAQEIRNDFYIAFEREEASDYTQGPARFVLATDGVQNCAAMLMTFDLSMQIQRALRMQHAYDRAEISGLRERQALMRFETRVEREVASCRIKILTLEEETNVDAEKVAALQLQMEVLELLLDDVRGRRQTVHMNLRTQVEDLCEAQSAAIALVEQAYFRARILEPEDHEPVQQAEELDLEREYAAFYEQLQSHPDTDRVPASPPLDTSRDYAEVPMPTEEEQEIQRIVDLLWASKEDLDLARRDFEDRETHREQEYKANVAAADQGGPTTDDSPEAFDMRWVVKYRELTRDLIDSEAAYADAKRMAFEAGVPLPFADNDTICGGVGDGVGYTSSVERDMMASVPSPGVRKWLSDVGGEAGSVGEEAREEDEWEADEVGISDSVSLVAEGKERERIDRWKSVCSAEKSE